MKLIKLRSSKHRRIALGILLILNFIVFSLFDPFSSAILIILLGFLVCFVDLMVITYFGLLFIEIFLPQIKNLKGRLMMSLSLVELLVLALSSLGQLTWWVVGIATVIWALGYFYSLYLKTPSRAGR